MTYCSVNKVRQLSGLESHQVTDGRIRELRDETATPELNRDVNQSIDHERVNRTISSEKGNDVDGENTVFYLRETHKSELQVGDRNDDGKVEGDDLDFYFLDEDDNRTENLDVTLLDREIGKVDVKVDGSAPSDGDLFVSYEVSPVNQDGYSSNDFDGSGPDHLIETACAQLTAAYAFTNVEASKLKDFSVGNVSINSQSGGAEIMRNQYRDTRRRITQKQVIQSGENTNTTRGAFTHV